MASLSTILALPAMLRTLRKAVGGAWMLFTLRGVSRETRRCVEEALIRVLCRDTPTGTDTERDVARGVWMVSPPECYRGSRRRNMVVVLADPNTESGKRATEAYHADRSGRRGAVTGFGWEKQDFPLPVVLAFRRWHLLVAPRDEESEDEDRSTVEMMGLGSLNDIVRFACAVYKDCERAQARGLYGGMGMLAALMAHVSLLRLDRAITTTSEMDTLRTWRVLWERATYLAELRSAGFTARWDGVTERRSLCYDRFHSLANLVSAAAHTLRRAIQTGDERVVEDVLSVIQRRCADDETVATIVCDGMRSQWDLVERHLALKETRSSKSGHSKEVRWGVALSRLPTALVMRIISMTGVLPLEETGYNVLLGEFGYAEEEMRGARLSDLLPFRFPGRGGAEHDVVRSMIRHLDAHWKAIGQSVDDREQCLFALLKLAIGETTDALDRADQLAVRVVGAIVAMWPSMLVYVVWSYLSIIRLTPARVAARQCMPTTAEDLATAIVDMIHAGLAAETWVMPKMTLFVMRRIEDLGVPIFSRLRDHWEPAAWSVRVIMNLEWAAVTYGWNGVQLPLPRYSSQARGSTAAGRCLEDHRACDGLTSTSYLTFSSLVTVLRGRLAELVGEEEMRSLLTTERDELGCAIPTVRLRPVPTSPFLPDGAHRFAAAYRPEGISDTDTEDSGIGDAEDDEDDEDVPHF